MKITTESEIERWRARKRREGFSLHCKRYNTLVVALTIIYLLDIIYNNTCYCFYYTYTYKLIFAPYTPPTKHTPKSLTLIRSSK